MKKRNIGIATAGMVVGGVYLMQMNGGFANSVDRERFASNLTTQTDTYFSGQGFNRDIFTAPSHRNVDKRDAQAEIENTIHAIERRANWDYPTARQREIAACSALIVTSEIHRAPVDEAVKAAYLAPQTETQPNADRLGAQSCIDHLAALIATDQITKIYYVNVARFNAALALSVII